MSPWSVPSAEEVLEGLVAAALAEDVGPGDWTTEWTVPQEHTSRAVIVAKGPLVVSGATAVRAIYGALDPELEVTAEVQDGGGAEPGDILFRLRGATRGILTGERAALNFLGRLSGVATLTRLFVEQVQGTAARIVDTRKTTPGWRLLEKAAVVHGGGANHRLGLHDMVMVKDNHVDAAGGVGEATRRALEGNDRGIPVEVEVRSLTELQEVLPLGVDRILLDNMDLETLREAVSRVGAFAQEARETADGPWPRPELEASGNVSLGTVRDVAQTGVDLISVGALTHSAPYADVSLQVQR